MRYLQIRQLDRGNRVSIGRKHLPPADVAAAGGWKSTETLQRCYQQPDERTMLSVVLDGAELREKKP
jgi:hypothetical protein